MRFLNIALAGYRIYRHIKRVWKKDTSYKDAGSLINKELEKLGPTFIKLGQMLSMRSDMIPPELADEFRKLLDHGVSIDQRLIYNLFLEEFKKPISEVFDSFEDRPQAVASLSQVHKAVYKGRAVVVKFQKPNIRGAILSDLHIIRRIIYLSRFLPFIPGVSKYQDLMSSVTEEFFKWIDRELDYRLEALNISRIKKGMADIEYFLAPEVISGFSSQTILTMSFIDGPSLNELFNNIPNISTQEYIEYKDIKFKKLEFISNMIKIVYAQILENGYFHADPHPANILITKNNKIGFVDFGIIGALNSGLKETLAEIIKDITDRNIPAVAHGLASLDEIDGKDQIQKIEEKIKNLLDNWQSGSVLEMTTAEIFFKLLLIAKDSRIDLPLSVIIIGKTLLEYDGVLRKFDPELDIIKAIQDHARGSGSGLDQITSLIPESIKDLVANGNLGGDILEFANQLLKDNVDISVHFGPSPLVNKK